jgi:hypothetical protein
MGPAAIAPSVHRSPYRDRNQKVIIAQQARRAIGRGNDPGANLPEWPDAVGPMPRKEMTEARWINRTHWVNLADADLAPHETCC